MKRPSADGAKALLAVTGKHMGLRFRALATVGAILLLVASLSFGVTAWIVLAGFSRVEKADAEKNVARAREAIEVDIESILAHANDWAAWDDCYRFVRDQNPEFVATNLPDQGWQEQKSNGMIVIDAAGKVVYRKFWDLDKNVEAAEPVGLLDKLAPGKPLNRHGDVASKTGAIVMLDEGPMIVASRPIITTAHTGPIAGTLVWLRWLSAPRLAEYQRQTRLVLETVRVDRAAPPGEGAAALAALVVASPGTTFVRPRDENTISGYALYRDEEGKPAMLLHASMPRDIHAQARSSLWTAVIAFGVLAAFSCMLMLFFVDRLVVRRAIRMTGEVQAVASSKDRTQRIAVVGSDELARLASNINALLATIETAERDLVRVRETALQAARVKAQFLANVSHEIRTPLNGIIGLGRLALDTTLTPEQREYLQAIGSSGQTLLALVNDILDLSKVESGKLTLEKTPFDLRALLDETLVPLRPKAEEHGLKLELSIAPELPPAFVGDPLRIRQVVTNLVGNALKFTLHGSVNLRVAPGAARDGHPTIRFSVTDTGIGIPTASQGRIFEAFSQADSTTTRKFGGTGLGLTISSQILEAMGGKLQVESREGHGSTFWFEIALPVHRGKVAKRADESGGVFPAAGRRLKVLLADDNPVNRLVGQRTLEKLGHSSTVVVGGEEAVNAAAKGGFDVILLDIQMPGVDGFEALRLIRSREAELAFRTPIVALTAHAMPGAAEASLRAGFDGHLVKPLDPMKLASALRRAVDKDAAASVAPRPSAIPTATAIVRGELLRHVGNDEDLLFEIIGIFLKSADEDTRVIRAAMDAGDLRQLGAHAHRLNGSLRTLGARKASAGADEVERLSREGKTEEARAAAKQFLRLLEVAVQELTLLTK